jgi:PAS domain S-box-containing protein
MIGINQDITERKQAEESLKNNERLLRDVINGSSSPIFLKDLDGRFITINTSLERMFGISREELKGKTDYDIAPQEVADSWRTHDNEVMVTGKAIQIEEVADLPDGHHIFLANKFPLVDDDGKVYGIGSISHDITERKKAEEALRVAHKQAERYGAEIAALMDAVPAAVFVAHDTECNRMSGNRITQELLGLPPTANFSKSASSSERPINFLAMKDGREIPADQLPVQIAARGQEIRNYEFDLVFRDGTVRTLLGDAVPLFDKNGLTRGAIGVFVDITGRKQTEEALRVSERLYRAIGESIDYGIWVCDPQGRNIYASESFLKLVGITQEQCSEFGWGDVLHPDDTEATIAAWKQCVQSGGPWYREHRYRGADGQWHPVLACGVAVRNEQGEVTAWAGINLDISRIKQAEGKILKLNEEMKARNLELEFLNKELETFTYSTSHDLRAPIRCIKGFSEIILEKHVQGLDEKSKKLFSRIIDSAVKMDDIINALLSLSRIGKQVLNKTTLDMKQLALSAFAESRLSSPEKDVQFEAQNIPPAQGDKVLIQMIFTNLIENALKFTRKSPTAKIEVGATQVNEQNIYFVKDNGAGFDMKYAEKLFAPFQRLHGVDEFPGFGIGLSTVQRIIQRHGGRIWAEGEVGKGATFYFTLN